MVTHLKTKKEYINMLMDSQNILTCAFDKVFENVLREYRKTLTLKSRFCLDDLDSNGGLMISLVTRKRLLHEALTQIANIRNKRHTHLSHLTTLIHIHKRQVKMIAPRKRLANIVYLNKLMSVLMSAQGTL